MDDNLLASIFRTNDKIKECLNQNLDLSLTESEIQSEKPTSDQNKATNNNKQSTQSNPSSTQHPEEDALAFEERYIVSVINAKQAKDESSMRKGLYIAYEISITRISDGYTKSVFRRFREIRNLYRDLIHVDEEIADNTHIVFPEYTEGWFGSSQVDPESALVQRRKSDLQLFHQYPVLFHHMKVIDFLELKSMPAKSHSTFSMHFAKKVDVEVELSEELISDIVYNPRTGRLENIKAIPYNPGSPLNHEPINNPSCVEFISHAEKFSHRKIKA